MIELPDFVPLKTTETLRSLTRTSLDALDHVLVVVGENAPAGGVERLPHGKQLAMLLARATRRGDEIASSRAANRRATGITVARFDASTTFGALSWGAKTVRECLREQPASLGVALVGLDAEAERRATDGLVAAAHAAAFALPKFKSKPDSPTGASLKKLQLLGARAKIDLAAARAQALGNNLARWFTALPPNVKTAENYRTAIAELFELALAQEAVPDVTCC